MITCVIKDNGEKSVTDYTYQQLWKELKDISGSELIVSDDWFAPLWQTKNKYICFVEADCLVSPGFFRKQMTIFQNNSFFRKLAMLCPVVGVTHWNNTFYGYSLSAQLVDGVTPNRSKKSNLIYPVQMGFVPGSIIRVNMLKEAFGGMAKFRDWEKDLVFMSAQISLSFWKQGDGNRIHLNPDVEYVTTEEYVNDIGKFDVELEELHEMFRKEFIS